MCFICSAPVYEYKGWLFELHYWCGPWPLKKNGDPRKRAGVKFWRMWSDFCDLTEEEQKKHRVGGGCIRF